MRYKDLVKAARNSLEYSFLPGDSLWMGRDYAMPVEACSSFESDACRAFVASSPKASLQVKLERDFTAFETDIKGWSPL